MFRRLHRISHVDVRNTVIRLEHKFLSAPNPSELVLSRSCSGPSLELVPALPQLVYLGRLDSTGLPRRLHVPVSLSSRGNRMYS